MWFRSTDRDDLWTAISLGLICAANENGVRVRGRLNPTPRSSRPLWRSRKGDRFRRLRVLTDCLTVGHLLSPIASIPSQSCVSSGSSRSGIAIGLVNRPVA